MWLSFAHPIHAADPAIAAIDRARALLSSRGYTIGPVTVIEEWPVNGPSSEALAASGTIFVNRRSEVLRAAVRWRLFDVVLASLLLHEQSHLDGANELEALQIELDWLAANHADREVIHATKQSIDREKHRKKPHAASIGPTNPSNFP
jgi:hypothetical protein